VRRPLVAVLGAANTAMLRANLRLTTHTVVADVPVVDFAPSGSFTQALPNIREAVQLLATHDPRRFARIRRDLKYIVVTRTLLSEVAEYWPNLRACLLDASFATAQPPSTTALNIVHEATHARLWRAGIRYNELVRARVERCCIGEELAFAMRVPNGDELQGAARRKLYDASYWSDASMRDRKLKRLESRGVPRWLARLGGG
jgi:hypothetical protein